MKPHTQRMENDQRRTPNQGQMSGNIIEGHHCNSDLMFGNIE